MKIVVLFVIFLLNTSCLFAQVASVLPPNVRAAFTLERLNNMAPSDILYGMPIPEKKLIGDAYLNQEWRSGSLMLYASDKMLEGYPIRYDIMKDELEIRGKNGVKVIEGKKIKSFVWLDSVYRKPQYFINAKEYETEDGVSSIGFYQVLTDGKLPLFKHTEAVIRKANYSLEFDMGSRDDKIVKKAKLVYAREGKVFSMPSGKKKFLALFEGREEEVNKFIRINSLSLTDENHVEKIVEYYSSL